MGLINDDVAPVELLEVVLLLDDHLIGGHHHIKLARLQLQLLVKLHVSQHCVSVQRLLHKSSAGRGIWNVTRGVQLTLHRS